MLKLNCGCGGEILPSSEGWVNIDSRKVPGVDRVIDLEKENFDYADNSVDHILLRDFLEHLSKNRQIPFLKDVYRVLKPGGDIYIQLPDLECLAKRYLNILENPTDIQHSLTAEQLSNSLYGGQEYAGNFHKWGYDAEYLSRQLTNIGFLVEYAHGDGGQNLLCGAHKLPSNLYLVAGGGLGDIIQNSILSNPTNTDTFDKDQYPCTNPAYAIWYRRLWWVKNIAKRNVTLYVHSHNKYSVNLFYGNPYIDDIEIINWADHKLHEESEDWTKNIGNKYPLNTFLFGYNYIRPCEPLADLLYLSENEEYIINMLKQYKDYIVVHPDAGNKHRCVPSYIKYIDIIKSLSEKYTVIIVGAGNAIIPDMDNVINLYNKVSIKVSVKITSEAKGFVGTHSNMVLVAWYANIPVVCLVPPTHEGGQTFEDFFDSGNCTVYGNKRPNSKTIIVKNDDIDISNIVSHFDEHILF